MKAITQGRSTRLLIAICLLFSGYIANQAMSSQKQTNLGARLIIRRGPNLGKNVIVQLSIDGVGVTGLTYGRSYNGNLTPGRHVISTVATPNAKRRTPTQMTLDVQNGQTYNFTAVNGGSGQVVLRGGLQHNSSTAR